MEQRELSIPAQHVEIIRDEWEDNLNMLQSLVDSISDIRDQDHCDSVNTAMKKIARLQKTVEDHRKHIKKPFMSAGRQIDGAIKPFNDRLKHMTAKLKTLLAEYDAKVEAERARQEAERHVHDDGQNEDYAGVPALRADEPALPDSGIHTRKKREVEIKHIDFRRVPVELLRIDEAEVNRRILAGETIDGIDAEVVTRRIVVAR